MQTNGKFLADKELSRLANAYDTRYHGVVGTNEITSSTSPSNTSSGNQNLNFGRFDGTGVEAVSDIMPTELECLIKAVKDAMNHRPDSVLRILDFGCGDGRYLPAFIRISQHILSSTVGTFKDGMEILCLDVSAGALEELQEKIKRWQSSASMEEREFLRFRFLVTGASDSAQVVERQIREGRGTERLFHLSVCGWGTMSCIPDLVEHDGYKAGIKKPRQFSFLQMLSKLSYSLLNITSTKNNFIREQRRFNAMRQARREILEMKNGAFTDHVDGSSHYDRILKYLETKLGLGTHTGDGFYYGKHQMFFSAVDFEEEMERTKQAGFDNVDIRICNVMNFYDILSHSRKRKLNNCLIRLCEMQDIESSKTVDKKCKSFLRDGFRKAQLDVGSDTNPVFMPSREKRINQVARYFIVYGTSYVRCDHPM